MIQRYWTQERFYHHPAPVNMICALREALRLIYEEGLEARFARHRLTGEALVAGLRAMGMEMAAQDGGGLGDFKGKGWRIGLMGHGSRKKNVFAVLTALNFGCRVYRHQNLSPAREGDQGHTREKPVTLQEDEVTPETRRTRKALERTGALHLNSSPLFPNISDIGSSGGENSWGGAATCP